MAPRIALVDVVGAEWSRRRRSPLCDLLFGNVGATNRQRFESTREAISRPYSAARSNSHLCQCPSRATVTDESRAHHEQRTRDASRSFTRVLCVHWCLGRSSPPLSPRPLIRPACRVSPRLGEYRRSRSESAARTRPRESSEGAQRVGCAFPAHRLRRTMRRRAVARVSSCLGAGLELASGVPI